jgi:hypothetical protein
LRSSLLSPLALANFELGILGLGIWCLGPYPLCLVPRAPGATGTAGHLLLLRLFHTQKHRSPVGLLASWHVACLCVFLFLFLCA